MQGGHRAWNRYILITVQSSLRLHAESGMGSRSHVILTIAFESRIQGGGRKKKFGHHPTKL